MAQFLFGKGIISHLIHGGKTDWMVRAEIISGDGPDKEFQHFDRFAQFKDRKGKTLATLLTEFETLRKTNLKKLRSKTLTVGDLGREGVHPGLGTVSLT